MKNKLILLTILILSLQFQSTFANNVNHIKKHSEKCPVEWNCFDCKKGPLKPREFTGLKNISTSEWQIVYQQNGLDFNAGKFDDYTELCNAQSYIEPNNGPFKLEQLRYETCDANKITSPDFLFPKDLDANKHCKLAESVSKNQTNVPSDTESKNPKPKLKPIKYNKNPFEDIDIEELQDKVGLISNDNSHLKYIKQFKDDINSAKIPNKKIFENYKLKHINFVKQLNELILFYDVVANRCGGSVSNISDFGTVKIDDKNYGPKKVSRDFTKYCQNDIFEFGLTNLYQKHSEVFDDSSEYVKLRDEGLTIIQDKYKSAKKDGANAAAEAARIAAEAEAARIAAEAKAARIAANAKARIAAEAEAARIAAEAEAARIAAEAEAAKKEKETEVARLQSIEDARKQKAAFWDTIWSIVTFTLFGIITVTAGFMLGSRKNKKTDSSNIEFNEKQRELNIKIKTLEEKNKSLERLIEKSLSKSEPKPSTKTNVPHEIVKELSEKEKQAVEDKSRQSSYWDAIDNPNLIEKFATTYNVIVLDKVGRVKKGENALLQVDQKSLEKSNFWAVPYKDVWVILPGRTLSINAAALTADDGRYGRELFAGIFKLEFGSQFEVTRQTLAKKTNDGFLVFQQGTVMLPK